MCKALAPSPGITVKRARDRNRDRFGGGGDGEREIDDNREAMERGLCMINPKMENSNVIRKYS